MRETASLPTNRSSPGESWIVTKSAQTRNSSNPLADTANPVPVCSSSPGRTIAVPLMSFEIEALYENGVLKPPAVPTDFIRSYPPFP